MCSPAGWRCRAIRASCRWRRSPGNDFNLNLPRYIDSSEAEDLQDIEAHLRGGIPERDIDALEAYWQVCPQLREALFRPLRPGYLELAVAPAELKATITAHPQFAGFLAGMAQKFAGLARSRQRPS